MEVLVVENDPMNAKLFQMILTRKGGYEVSVTDSPNEVLDKVRSGQIALVVMDISLGDATYEGVSIDGVGITRIIKQDDATKRIPVLLATAHAMHGDRETLLADSGAEDYVSKPILDHHDFLHKVSSLIIQPSSADSP